MTWLDDLIRQHDELESPRAFWYWSGLCAISAVVKDSVYLDRFRFKTYANIYVMLHAASGLKKGPPVALARKLVKEVNNTTVISGRSSIQGILKKLGTGHSSPGGRINRKSTAFIVASEFSSSLVADPAAMTILTDLYDRMYHDGEYESLLKMEEFQLIDPTLTLLVATNEAHFEDFIDAKDVHGGFIGRMFVIAETRVQRLNPLMRKLKTEFDFNGLVKYLKELTKLSGPFTIEESVIQLYEEWYMEFYRTVEEQDVEDPTGTIQRFGDSVLKVAMLLSLSYKPDLIIHEQQMEESIDVCETLIGNVRQTTLKKGRSQQATNKGLIINELMKREGHKVSRAVLAKKYWMHFDVSDLDEIMKDFETSGMVTASARGNQIIYEMPKKQVEEMERYLKGKNK